MTSLKPCPMERWVVSLSRPPVLLRADPLTSTSPVPPPLSHGPGGFSADLNSALETQPTAHLDALSWKCISKCASGLQRPDSEWATHSTFVRASFIFLGE